MLINTFLDTEDFVHLYYPEDEPAASQGCGAGARLATKYPPRSPSPECKQASSSEMSERERERFRPPPPEPPPARRARAADLYPRQRTHYDEPGLDAGLTPICGEFVQWVGRTSEGTIAMSNYRVHVQPRRRGVLGVSVPLRLIDAVEVRDLTTLLVLCKHGGQLKCSFSSNEQCMEWWRRLSTSLVPLASFQETFAAAYAAWAREQPPASVHRDMVRHEPQPYWFHSEMERLGFSGLGAWRVSSANGEYKLCPSYPPYLLVPAVIGDDDLDSVARFRAMRRVPAVVWRHRGSGAVLARSSQPEVGWLGWRSAEDERLLAALAAACAADRPHAKPPKLLIVDARSYASAVTNRARGGGCECQQYYPSADIQFMSLPNIHHVRRSFHQMRALAAEPADQPNWHSSVERTLWLQYVAGVLRASAGVARALAAGRPVLVHCSDGWDRTPQLVAAAQLMLDPYYRTVQGFRILIEREWLDFGHKFADRCGHQFGPEDPNERSPIFLQWLHVVYQMMVQYPCSFEFNEAYLVKLAVHVHSCMFGTFLGNSRRERTRARGERAASVWRLLGAAAYRNHLYCGGAGALWPDSSARAVRLWWAPHADRAPPPPRPAPGIMTKTRSYDNLLNAECGKKLAQRRSSDPSLTPDINRLAEGAAAALTDSCVDSLPAAQGADCVDAGAGAEAGAGVVAGVGAGAGAGSSSSSLERELAAAGDAPARAPPLADLPHITKESARTRNISITWRSVSESSNQSSTGFDIPENSPQNRTEQGPENHVNCSPFDNHNSTDGDVVNHNIVEDSSATSTCNGDVDHTGVTNGIDDVTTKFLEVDLNYWSSGGSSEDVRSPRAAQPRRPPRRTGQRRAVRVRVGRGRGGGGGGGRGRGRRRPGARRRPAAGAPASDHPAPGGRGGVFERATASRARRAAPSTPDARAHAAARVQQCGGAGVRCARQQRQRERQRQRQRGGGGRGGQGGRVAARQRRAALPALPQHLLAGAPPPPLPAVRRRVLRRVRGRRGRRAPVPPLPPVTATTATATTTTTTAAATRSHGNIRLLSSFALIRIRSVQRHSDKCNPNTNNSKTFLLMNKI